MARSARREGPRLRGHSREAERPMSCPLTLPDHVLIEKHGGALPERAEEAILRLEKRPT